MIITHTMKSFNIALTYQPEFRKYNRIGLHNFKMDFPKEYKLSGDWEVGLSEISFTNCVNNIEDGLNLYLISHGSKQDQLNYYKMDELVNHGNYSIDQLIDRINEISERFMKFYEKSFDDDQYIAPKIRKIGKNLVIRGGFSINKREMFYLIPAREICKVLGFDFKDIYVSTRVIFEN